MGFEPVISRLPVRCSTNWAMKPLTLGAGQLWVHMFPWKKWVLVNFFQASLRNCINCVHCDDHFFIFISFPQFIYDLFHICINNLKSTGRALLIGNEAKAHSQHNNSFVITYNIQIFANFWVLWVLCFTIIKVQFNKPSQGGVGGSSRHSTTALATCFCTSSVTSCSKASPSRCLQLIARANWNNCLPKESFVMMVKNSEVFFWCLTGNSCMEHWNISLRASTGDTSRNFITQLLRSPRSCPKRSFLIFRMFLLISSSMSIKTCSLIVFHLSLSHFLAFFITYQEKRQNHNSNFSIYYK